MLLETKPWYLLILAILAEFAVVVVEFRRVHRNGDLGRHVTVGTQEVCQSNWGRKRT